MKISYILRKSLSYIGILVICTLIALLIKSCSTETLTINIDVENDRDLSEHIAGSSIGNFDFQHKNQDADILIRESSDKTIDGYEKLDKALTSTIVLMFDSQVKNQNGGFSKITSSCYRADLTSILVAIEKGETWDSLGVHKDVANGEVKLVIPNEGCSYYDEVIDTIYYALNNFKPLTDEVKTELKPRVDTIVTKCDKVSNIMQAVMDSCKSDDKRVMLGPEYLFRSVGGYSYFGSDYDDYYMVYLNEYITFTADIYINKNVDSTKASLLESFKNSLYTEGGFSTTSGWRVTDAEYNVSSKIRSFMYSNIN